MSCNCKDKGTCSSCFDGVEIPVGPQGDTGEQGNQGLPGTNGTNGTSGTNGTDGTNGTNAFKYVKQAESNLDGGAVTVSQVELANAGVLPEGYIQGGGVQEFCDLNVKVWLRNNDPSPSGNWEEAQFGLNLANVSVNPTTGLITVTLTGGSSDVLVRIVILG